jgi:hypothetical protein
MCYNSISLRLFKVRKRCEGGVRWARSREEEGLAMNEVDAGRDRATLTSDDMMPTMRRREGGGRARRRNGSSWDDAPSLSTRERFDTIGIGARAINRAFHSDTKARALAHALARAHRCMRCMGLRRTHRHPRHNTCDVSRGHRRPHRNTCASLRMCCGAGAWVHRAASSS